ncbi:MAG: hypothetical protein ABI981_12920 [Betaproteobacteria bacterium]
MIKALVLSLCGFVIAVDASAFTFSDGATATCRSGGKPVNEVDGGPDSRVVVLNHVARTDRDGDGYTITWNATKLASLPPAMHDLIFFHECAHATVPTQDELRANCEGLRMMRAANRGGFAVESKLAAFYGPGNDYWAKTLKCADAPVKEPTKPSSE